MHVLKKRERAGMGMKISRVSESKLKEMCISNLKHCKNCCQLLFVSAFFNNVVIVQVSAVSGTEYNQLLKVQKVF